MHPASNHTRAIDPISEGPQSTPAGVAASVLRMVLYYDIFRHPLTRAELVRLVGGPVDEAIAGLVAAGAVEVEGAHVCRVGQRAHVAGRKERARQAELLWSDAQLAAATLARFPHVRGIFVTGGLSKQSAQAGGDVDYLLLIEPGWVWTTKSALQVLRRALPERTRNLFCTNYLLDTDHLLVDDRNLFTAMELATAVPLYGPEACSEFLKTNAWAAALVPGYAWNVERAAHARPLHAPRWAERLVAPVGPWVEDGSLSLWSRFWDRKYDWLSDGDRQQRFKRRPEIATNHLHDFQQYVLREYRQRCAAAGIDPG